MNMYDFDHIIIWMDRIALTNYFRHHDELWTDQNNLHKLF